MTKHKNRVSGEELIALKESRSEIGELCDQLRLNYEALMIEVARSVERQGWSPDKIYAAAADLGETARQEALLHKSAGSGYEYSVPDGSRGRLSSDRVEKFRKQRQDQTGPRKR